MVRTRPAPGGGTVVEIAPEDLTGWINRFSGRNGGLASIVADATSVRIVGGDGTTAAVAVPFGPMDVPADREGVEALLAHLARFRRIALLAVRGGAHSAGIAIDGTVEESKTHRPYLQGRTAAGGWSQQRYARRRANQLTFSLEHAADGAARVLVPEAAKVDALVLGGDATALRKVMADPRLSALTTLPTRTFGDVPEPRRSVLDDLARRALVLEITVR